ncbi:HD domain-containing phosphohydrolase [uncultured Nitrospira sp.]|uniref:HD-GYP domain-containing protein n=1 Tax=uncultured Nitrospira sp. TaxID=157176 RepID=UPI003140752F
MAFVPLHATALRLGLYIKIEGSWFSHPFPTNSFKIELTKDLETIRGLTKVKLYFDPDRSDPEGVHSDHTKGPDRKQTQDTVESDKEPSNESESDPTRDSLEEEADFEDPIQRKIAQHEAFQVYQEHLQAVGGQFQEVVQEAKQAMQDVISGRPRGLRTAQKIVGELYEILDITDNSRALLNLIGSNEPNEEFFLHALNVCSLSLMVGQDLGFSREDAEKLALGALFHDIGELKFSAEQLLRKGSMSAFERKNFLSTHPKYGVEMAEKLPNIPFEAIDVIRQHHERLNGSGFPAGKKDGQISKFAKIVMVVDEYDELCHHPDPAKSLIPSEALSYLYVKCRHTLWHDAVVSLISQLGVYPPGSLVNLSNQKIGIVTSVNLANRLRPVILVYDESASPDEPIILNLSKEDETLSIVSAIRPVDLSLRIRECLNPRRIISYFPSGSPAESRVGALNSLAGS